MYQQRRAQFEKALRREISNHVVVVNSDARIKTRQKRPHYSYFCKKSEL